MPNGTPIQQQQNVIKIPEGVLEEAEFIKCKKCQSEIFEIEGQKLKKISGLAVGRSEDQYVFFSHVKYCARCGEELPLKP